MQAVPLSIEDYPRTQNSRIRRWLGPTIVAALYMILYAGVIRDMVVAWLNAPGASHGLLIPPLVGVIVWSQRERIRSTPAERDGRGLWLLAPASAFYMVGHLGAEYFLTRISLIINITMVVWTFWGKARVSVLKFPILLLATMVPIPQLIYKSLSGPLQLLASAVATEMAQAAGVAVFQDGNIIHLAGTSLGVEEACSGLQSISALTVGSLLVGYLRLERKWLRVALFFSSFPIAIAANVFRVGGTAILADYWPEIAIGFYHYFSGWLVFVCAFGLLLGVAGVCHIVERRWA